MTSCKFEGFIARLSVSSAHGFLRYPVKAKKKKKKGKGNKKPTNLIIYSVKVPDVKW